MPRLATIRRLIAAAPSLADFWTRIENLSRCAVANECTFMTQERADTVEGSCFEEALKALGALNRRASPATVRSHLAMALAWSVVEEEAAELERVDPLIEAS